MQISLRNLLLIFLAFFLAIGVAYSWESLTKATTQPRWTRALIEVRRIQGEIEWNVVPRFREESLIEDANRWLSGVYYMNDPRSEVLYPQPEKDPWGRAYVAATMGCGSNAKPRIGVYSLGRDGVSKSNGTDPDDLNSWDENSGICYRREFEVERRQHLAIIAGILTPFTYAVMLVIGWHFCRRGKA